MNKNIVAAGILLSICLTLSTRDAVADEAGGTLEKIAKSGEIRIGYRTDASPLSYENADGLPSGYSVDICRRIAAAIKSHLDDDEIDVKFVSVSSDERIEAVKKGLIDIECGATTITLTRQESVDFTLPTFVTGGGILSLASSDIRRLSDLAGKKVGVVKDTTTVTKLKSYIEQNLIDADLVIVEDRLHGMKQLNRGDIDAFASDQIVLIGQIIEAIEPKRYTLVDDIFSFEPYGMVVRRNDAEFRLVANRAISQLYRSGQNIRIFDKWIGRIGVRPSPILAAMYQLNTLPE